MKEIGMRLKEARESIGVSLEEAATDLKTTEKELDNLEQGNMDSFKDVFVLKYFIRDYAKYLGLDKDDMVDEFNEYLFDYTSKLSLEEIKKATKEEAKKDDNKVKSPYTLIEGNSNKRIIFVSIAIVIIGIVVAVLLFNDNIDKPDDNIVYNEIVK